jgi:hypothetical protein
LRAQLIPGKGWCGCAGLIDYFNVTEGTQEAEGGDVSISAGLYVVLLGAALALAGALIRERSVRSVTADGPPPT